MKGLIWAIITKNIPETKEIMLEIKKEYSELR